MAKLSIIYNSFQLETYDETVVLDRLVPGVDNTRYDVYLSQDLSKKIGKISYLLIIEYSNASENYLGDIKESNLFKEKEEFKRLCADILQESVNKAKLDREIQVNFLVQTAIAKLILKEINIQFGILTEHYKTTIRKKELEHRSINEIIHLKKELSDFQQNRKILFRCVAREIFQYTIEVYNENFSESCFANFGSKSILSNDFFSNPILHVENAVDDFLMIEEYVLFGHRLGDAINYETLITLINEFFSEMDDNTLSDDEPSEGFENEVDTENRETTGESKQIADSQVDRLINQVENFDELFGYFETEKQYQALRKEKGPKEKIKNLKKRFKFQKRLLDYIYKKFNRSGLVDRITAVYEMQPLYLEYCPPLLPHDVLQFLVMRKERKSTINKLKRLKVNTGKPVSLKPLQKKIKQIRNTNIQKKKMYLSQFLKGFSSYHRDYRNYSILRDAMDWVSLTTDKKAIKLSRANHTLYEFLLPHESVSREKPVINHVIIKTDVRGSTDITHQINERGLNPAFYFSQNFFDPITAILPEYGASKVFIEGDAIILSISEHEETPIGWYSVARACGLAIKILLITQRYNSKNKQAKLPKLEQGIGISYLNRPPAYLFDGDNRIMISPAINLADRLSGCTKTIRKIMPNSKRPFNLYVFKSAVEEEDSATIDDQFLRYNVNGIELNAAGFKKLSEEINLKAVDCDIPNFSDKKTRVFTGRFPTMSGKYQRLVIREARIPAVVPTNLSVTNMTDKKYYEVCTNMKLYEYVKRKT